MKVLLPLLVATLAFAQDTPEKKLEEFKATTKPVPEGLEETLRSRAARFYGLQMEGRFRQSEAMVCEDSKDTYYVINKKRWTSQEVQKVEFNDAFNDARVTVSLGSTIQARELSMAGKFNMATIWRLEDGNWCFHIPSAATKDVVTPFGPMKIGNPTNAAPLSTNAQPRMTVKSLKEMIKLDKDELPLNAKDRSTGEIDIFNSAPGPITIYVKGCEVEGLTCQLDKATLPGGEHARLKVTYQPRKENPVPVNQYTFILQFDPFMQSWPITLKFTK